MWLLLVICYTFSIVLVELSLKKLEKIKTFYLNKPASVDVMRRYDLNKWSRPSLYFGAILLIPRAILFNFCIIVHFLIAKLSMLGYQESDAPINPIRRKVLHLSSRIWARTLLFACGFWNITKIGSPEPASIIVSNHCSWVDIMYFLTSPELPSFVSKASVKNYPCVGIIAIAMQCIFIERTTDREGAIQAIRHRQQILNKGFPKLLVFPEGTTTNGFGLMPFKRGVFLELMPVQPVCIKYEQGGFSPCMEIVPIWVHVIMLMCQFSNRMTVTRLPVVSCRPGWTAEEYAEHVRTIIADNLGVPKVRYTQEEKAKLINDIFQEKPKEF